MVYGALGKNCPYCQFPIKKEFEVKWCPVCKIPHHIGCWQENEGCTTFACPAVFKNINTAPYLTVYENSLDGFKVNSEKSDTVIWRRILGFRSLTPWKMRVGVLFYLFITIVFLMASSFLGLDELYSLLIFVVILPISSVGLAANIVEGERKIVHILVITISALLLSIVESNQEVVSFLEHILIALSISVAPFFFLSLCLFSAINEKPIQRVIVLYFLILGLILALLQII